jgi:hypothetical protein
VSQKTIAQHSRNKKMAAIRKSIIKTDIRTSQMEDIATRLRSGTLHDSYPPFEHFATIDGLLRSHAAQPDEAQIPLICYPVRNVADFEEHTAGSIDRFTDAAVNYYMERDLSPVVRLWYTM